MFKALFCLLILLRLFFKAPAPNFFVQAGSASQNQENEEKTILAIAELNLRQRDDNPKINEIFRYNIIHTLYFFPLFSRDIPIGREKYGFVLQSGEIFAFHKNVLPELKTEKLVVLPAEFSLAEGFKPSTIIIGDGVCHLASFINWLAYQANLKTIARINHSFRPINGIPERFSISIRYSKTGNNSQNQNFYLENNRETAIEFWFWIEEEKLYGIIKAN